MEPDVPAQVALVRHIVEVTLGLRLTRIMFLPVPFLQKCLRERIPVGITLGVEARPGVAVPIPGAPHATPSSKTRTESPRARKRYNAYNPVTPAPMIITSHCSTSSRISFPTVGVRCRGCPIELSFRSLHRSGGHDKNGSPHTTTSSLQHRAMVASCFSPLTSALAKAVATTIECSVVKVQRPSLTAPRATEGPVLSLMQNLPRREALITVPATLPPSVLPFGSPWWTQRRWW